MKFSIKNFFSKCDQICRKLRICSHLLKKSLMENFSFVQCVVIYLRCPTCLMCLSVLRAYLLYVHTCLTYLCVFMPLPLTYFFFTCLRCHHFLRALPAFLFYILYVPIFFLCALRVFTVKMLYVPPFFCKLLVLRDLGALFFYMPSIFGCLQFFTYLHSIEVLLLFLYAFIFFTCLHIFY